MSEVEAAAAECDGEYIHIVVRQSSAAEIVVPIPSFCKPLAASTRPYGGGEAGLLASYYDPEKHVWVVRQLPLHESWPHRRPPLLIVRVVTLVDPTNLYEVRVTLTSVLDGIENDALYALQRRSQLYGLLAEEHLKDKSGAFLQTAGEQGLLPHLSEAVTLAAPLEVMEGYVLTGGGFLSDFPVLREGPALPRCMDAVYDDVLAGEMFCGPPKPPVATRAEDAQSEGAVGPSAAQEYTAWAVTAAANAGLVCLSLGLRRRSPQEWAHENALRDGSALGEMKSTPLRTNVAAAQPEQTDLSFSGSNAIEAVAPLDDPTGLVASWSSGNAGAPLPTPAGSSVSAPRPLLEMLILRGEIKVKLARKEGEEWRISLPPPHGSFSFAMGANRELMTVTRRTFYCE
ncbi:hypothetical protein ABL78_0007 [Leptomonas seymouri]|uniref:Uncharacterized protein n=1 Tax=Leptomonas seymouri TaxID=5684 RepID=A0A0N1I475_LEPSE|nr:hypothetical protein ABL78_0007 [Leptomonas seymouri]|eukprot:KPI90774.1 hypothetical protein ABL78_0007 [Leptomonas seymouri]